MKPPKLRRALPRKFYDRETVAVAKELLGKALISRVGGVLTGGVIVETEAYLSAGDPACHASRGQTKRNTSMFGPPGHLYVYMIHAKQCLNAVTEQSGRASAVLIRALEPIWGVDTMIARRRTHVVRDLTRGPARLCQALHVAKAQDDIQRAGSRGNRREVHGQRLWLRFFAKAVQGHPPDGCQDQDRHCDQDHPEPQGFQGELFDLWGLLFL